MKIQVNHNPLRREVLGRQASPLVGEVIVGAGVSWSVVGFSLSAFVVVMLVFTSTMTYNKKTTVSGWVVPDNGVIRLYASQAGTINSVLIQENEPVVEGQILAHIMIEQSITNGNIGAAVEQELTHELNAREGEVEAKKLALRLELEQVILQGHNTEQLLQESEANLKINLEMLRNADEEYQRAEELKSRGFISSRDLNARRGVVLQAQSQVSERRMSIIGYKNQIRENDIRQDLIRTQLKQISAEYRSTKANLNINLLKTKYGNEYVVKSPISGVIAALPISRGLPIKANEIVAIVLPSDGELHAELYVPTSAVGNLEVGQKVFFKYAAFPFQKYGLGEGKILSISRSTLAPSDIASQMVIDEPSYRVIASITKPYLETKTDQHALQSGMKLSGEIIVSRQSFIEKILEPLIRVRRS